MLPRGLILAIVIGVVAGPILGIILYEIDTHEQLVYVAETVKNIIVIITDLINSY